MRPEDKDLLEAHDTDCEIENARNGIVPIRFEYLRTYHNKYHSKTGADIELFQYNSERYKLIEEKLKKVVASS